MNILIDSNGLQAHTHLRDKQRLAVLIAQLCERGFQISFSTGEYLTSDELENVDILLFTTRRPTAHFGAIEEQLIHNFIQAGGGLLLLSNHGPHLTHLDAKLVENYGITIENTFFKNQLKSVPTVIADQYLNSSHPIMAGMGLKEVTSIVTNTTCSVSSEMASPIAYLPNSMRDILHHEVQPSNEQLFAVSLDLSSHAALAGSGRIVVVADSGFVGSDLTLHPGPGQITKGGNIQFVLNIFHWLGGDL